MSEFVELVIKYIVFDFDVFFLDEFIWIRVNVSDLVN